MSIPLSVILPVFNGEDFLPEAVQSVLCQTFTTFELLLIDDGSRDRTAQICQEFCQLDDRIRYLRNDSNQVQFF